jgi:hypothetical protein
VALVKTGQLVGHRDGLAIALEPLLGVDALGGEALGLASLVEERASLGEGRVGLRAALERARQRVAVVLQLGEQELALLDRPFGLLDGVLGHLQAAGVLGALRVQVEERPLELAPGARGAAIGPADRGLEPVA